MSERGAISMVFIRLRRVGPIRSVHFNKDTITAMRAAGLKVTADYQCPYIPRKISEVVKQRRVLAF